MSHLVGCKSWSPVIIYCLLLGTYEEEEEGDGLSKDCQFSRNRLAATAGGGCNDGSIPRDPAGPP